MSAPAETAPRKRPRPGRQAVIGLGAFAVVLGTIAGVSIWSNESQGLRAAVIGPRRVAPGDTVRWTVSVRDTAGSATDVAFDFGDGGTARPVQGRPPACDPARPASSEPVVLDHVYPAEGVYTARAQVTSGGCGAPVEKVEAIRTITVKPLRG